MIPVSVLMPVYNAERYVTEAVESILAQTFRDFEFLIIDDGSTDRSLSILKRYAERDPRIYLVSRPNRGLVPTLNELIAMARGEFVARIDADDVALPERFERQIAFLRGHPEVVCVGGAVLEIDPAGHELAGVHRHPSHDAGIQEDLLRGCTAIWHPTATMRREAVASVGGYREEMKHCEDLDLWLRLGEIGRLANLEEVVLRYRVHPDSKTERYHDEHNFYAKLASDQACDRRGVEQRFQPFPPYRTANDPLSRHNYSIRWGWTGFMRGDRQMALDYALQAIRWMPLRWSGWHLLACIVLKPIRRGT
jgi:glycosyltransferase involved in cell wall biosynthesis